MAKTYRQTIPGPVICPICGFHYVWPDDLVEHTTVHKRFLRACAALGYIPQSHESQEVVKSEAWPVVRDETHPLAERVAAAEAILRAHYDRSLRYTIFNGDPRAWQRHPSFESYVAQLLWRGTSFPPDVEEALVAKYGTARSQLSGTYWKPNKCSV